MRRASLIAEQWRRDIVVASRRLRKTPWFTAFAAGSLAAGVAVTATVYALVSATIWQPTGVDDPNSLIVLARPGGQAPLWRRAISRADADDYIRAQQSFARTAASTSINQAMTLGATFEPVTAEAVTGTYFDLLGVGSSIGRLLGPADDRDGAAPVVVLSDRLWRRAFGADPGIIGQSIRLGGGSFEVIGVAAAPFDDVMPSGPARSRAWIALSQLELASTVTSKTPQDDSRPRFTVLGRLRPGITVDQASAEASAFAGGLDRERPLPAAASAAPRPATRQWIVASVGAIQASLSTRLRIAGYVLIGIAALVLLVACTNLANLSLARGAARTHELAVRRALGASRRRLVNALLIESLLIAAIGTGAAFLLIRVLVRMFTVDLPVANQNVFSLAPSMSPRVIAFSGVAMFLSLAIFGLQPALQLTRDSARARMAAGAHTIVAPKRGAWRLVRWQVAIACSLLLLASVAVQYVVLLSRHDSGVDLDRLAIGTLVMQGDRWPESTVRATVGSVLERLNADPTIESAAAATGMPFGISVTPYASLRAPGRRAGDTVDALLMASTPGIFTTLGIPIEKGRAFNEDDTEVAPPVAILSTMAAREIFGTADAVGRSIEVKNAFRASATFRPMTIVGIAGDTDVQARLSRRSGMVYVPFTQDFSPGVTFAVRGPDPDASVRALRAAAAVVSPDLVLSGAGPAVAMLAPALPLTRLAVSIAVALGALALGLCMVGLHGILSQVLAARTREMGLRMALGATARDLRRMTLTQGLRPVAEGLVVGLLIGTLVRIALYRLTEGRVAFLDPLAIVALPILFALAGWVACAQPMRRAARVDPNVALRDI
jgi:predicted permease